MAKPPPKAGAGIVVVVVVAVAVAVAVGVVVVVVAVVVAAAAAAGYLTSTAHLASESLPPAVQKANEHSYKSTYLIFRQIFRQKKILSPTREKTFAK